MLVSGMGIYALRAAGRRFLPAHSPLTGCHTSHAAPHNEAAVPPRAGQQAAPLHRPAAWGAAYDTGASGVTAEVKADIPHSARMTCR